MYDAPIDRQLGESPDPYLHARRQRLHELGDLGSQPDPEFDDLARRIAISAGELINTPGTYAMVNVITDKQCFVGLYVPDTYEDPGRVMPRDHGFCPDVLTRKGPLVLDHVGDYPRFAHNPVVDEIGIVSYVGLRVVDHGIPLGTVCLVDTQKRPWLESGAEKLIRAGVEEVIEIIRKRDRHR